MLVVDDDATVLRTFAHVLRKPGRATLAVDDGKQVLLGDVAASDPDVLVLWKPLKVATADLPRCLQEHGDRVVAVIGGTNSHRQQGC